MKDFLHYVEIQKLGGTLHFKYQIHVKKQRIQFKSGPDFLILD